MTPKVQRRSGRVCTGVLIRLSLRSSATNKRPRTRTQDSQKTRRWWLSVKHVKETWSLESIKTLKR